MRRVVAYLAAVGVAGAVLVGTGAPVAAATEHCAGHADGEKVELHEETTTLSFAPGTEVCYKAGNEAFTVVVGADGVLRSAALHPRGKPKAISYYLVIGEPNPGA